jgi:exocyst complex component 8
MRGPKSFTNVSGKISQILQDYPLTIDRQVIFDGDLHLYIFQISYIYFTMIKHTAIIFQACFPIAMLSACVKWAKEHVDGFNLLLERQLSSVDEGSETYKACMKRAMIHAKMLSEVGFDFGGLVGRRAGKPKEPVTKTVQAPGVKNG